MAVLGEDASFEERLDEPDDATVSDAISHPAQQGLVVDLVEARVMSPSSTTEYSLVASMWISAMAS